MGRGFGLTTSGRHEAAARAVTGGAPVMPSCSGIGGWAGKVPRVQLAAGEGRIERLTCGDEIPFLNEHCFGVV